MGDVGQLKGSISSNIVIPICSAFFTRNTALGSLSDDTVLGRTVALNAVVLFSEDLSTCVCSWKLANQFEIIFFGCPICYYFKDVIGFKVEERGV